MWRLGFLAKEILFAPFKLASSSEHHACMRRVGVSLPPFLTHKVPGMRNYPISGQKMTPHVFDIGTTALGLATGGALAMLTVITLLPPTTNGGGEGAQEPNTEGAREGATITSAVNRMPPKEDAMRIDKDFHVQVLWNQ